MLLDLPSNRQEGWRWSDLSALPDIATRAPAGTGKMLKWPTFVVTSLPAIGVKCCRTLSRFAWLS